jgi:hypothetical protein
MCVAERVQVAWRSVLLCIIRSYCESSDTRSRAQCHSAERVVAGSSRLKVKLCTVSPTLSTGGTHAMVQDADQTYVHPSAFKFGCPDSYLAVDGVERRHGIADDAQPLRHCDVLVLAPQVGGPKICDCRHSRQVVSGACGSGLISAQTVSNTRHQQTRRVQMQPAIVYAMLHSSGRTAHDGRQRCAALQHVVDVRRGERRRKVQELGVVRGGVVVVVAKQYDLQAPAAGCVWVWKPYRVLAPGMAIDDVIVCTTACTAAHSARVCVAWNLLPSMGSRMPPRLSGGFARMKYTVPPSWPCLSNVRAPGEKSVHTRDLSRAACLAVIA